MKTTCSLASDLTRSSVSRRGCAHSARDEDGLLDLHLIGGDDWRGRLYRNLGGRRFRAVSSDEGGGDLQTAPSVSQFASWADYDDDGHQDVFIASFTNQSIFTLTNYMPCQMFRNEGQGRFGRVTNQITDDAIYGLMGAWGDYDNDGRVDLFSCASRWGQSSEWDSFLYRNLGGGRFERAWVGFTLPWGDAAAWGDYDNDGFLDVLLTEREGGWRGCTVFRNNGNGTFFRITAGPLVTTVPGGTLSAYEACWFDFDNDGFLDVYAHNGDDRGVSSVPNYLYHNDGNSNGWLKVKLVGVASNRDAVGAKVWATATFAGGSRRQRREISPGQFLGGNSRIAHFGLGDAEIVETLRVDWPSGQVTELQDVEVRRHLTITEAHDRYGGGRDIPASQGASRDEHRVSRFEQRGGPGRSCVDPDADQPHRHSDPPGRRPPTAAVLQSPG